MCDGSELTHLLPILTTRLPSLLLLLLLHSLVHLPILSEEDPVVGKKFEEVGGTSCDVDEDGWALRREEERRGKRKKPEEEHGEVESEGSWSDREGQFVALFKV